MCFMTMLLYSPDHVNISRCWSYDMLRNARSFYGGKTSHRTRGIIQALVQMTLELLKNIKHYDQYIK